MDILFFRPRFCTLKQPETARNSQKRPEPARKVPPESFNICVAKKCIDPKLAFIKLPRSFYKREQQSCLLSSVYVTTCTSSVYVTTT